MNEFVKPQGIGGPKVSLSEQDAPRRASDAHASLVGAAARVAEGAAAHAGDLDHDNAYPTVDVRALAAAGLLEAPLPVAVGGQGLGLDPSSVSTLARVLMTVGGGSLPLGRLYEGHVNAAKLVATYGTPAQVARFANRARTSLSAVWNTQAADGLRIAGEGGSRKLVGRKVFASGAGHIRYPLVTARDGAGDLFMVLPDVDDPTRADLSDWRAHGMRASASGAVDFSGIPVCDEDIVGEPDDFHKQPTFSGGAWRFAAVQTGGIAAFFDLARAHLVGAGRDRDPHQRARMGTAAMAVQSARQWVFEAARIAEDDRVEDDLRIAHVNLARLAVERAGLDVLELVHRSVGLAAFSRSHPIERLSRDLATYLRQPVPDQALCDAAAIVLSSPRPMVDLWPWR